MKKLISLVLAFMIIFSASATFSAEDTKEFDGYVYMTVEKLTLGQGFVVEPVKVGYYKEDSLGDIAERCLGDKSTFKGDISQYYLEGVIDGGNPQNWSEKDIPTDIYNMLTKSGEEITDRADENILQSYDFTQYGGWLFTVDNTGINAGAGSIKLGEDSSKGYCYEEGSVIRLEYSLYGYGEDIGISYGYMPFETTNTFADRSELIAYVSEIKDSGESEKYGEAYNNALNLLSKWNITEEEIESAVASLDEVGKTLSPDEAEDSRNVQWKGAMNNFKDGNAVTDIPVVKNGVEKKWSYALNRGVDSWGYYYAGQTVIVDNYLYATGGGNLHKVDIETGEGEAVATAGSSDFYYDYMAYGDGMLFVATSNSIEAFDIDTLNSIGKVTGKFNSYHPVQYNNGYVICNGNIFKVNKDSENALEKVGEGTIEGDSFGWSQGAFVGDYFYVTATNNIYCVDYKTNTAVYSYSFDPNSTSSSITGQVSYDENSGYLYWASYKQNYLHAIKINGDGSFDASSYTSSDIGQKSVCSPVVYNNRIYIAGQSGVITVINGDSTSDDFLSVIYKTDNSVMKIQSNPILSTAYEAETGSVYIYVQGYNAPGNIYYLEDNSEKTSGELTQLTSLTTESTTAYAFEQIAIDKDGCIYFYNEEGYLYCYGEKERHTFKEYTSNLDGTHKKICQKCEREETEHCTFTQGVCTDCQCHCEEGIYGDVNMDGVVDVRDAVVLQKYCVKAEQLTDSQEFVALFDGSKDISIRSVTLIQKYAGEVLKDTSIATKAVRYYI